MAIKTSALVGTTGKREYSELIESGNLTPTTVIMSYSDVVLRDQALAKLYRKIHKATEEYNALVPIAELKDLRRASIGMFELTSDFFSAILKARLRSKRGFVDWLADAWLAYSFGVVPMSHDVASIADTIQSKLDSHKKTVFSASEEKPIVKYSSTGLGTNVLTTHITGTRNEAFVGYLKYRFTAGYDFNVITASNYGYLSKLNLDSLKGLPSAIWEIIPWSFLIDYFLTVGTYLDDTFLLDPKPLVYFTEAKTVKGTCYENVSVSLRTNMVARSDLRIDSKVITPRQTRHVEYVRTKLSTMPNRIIRFKTDEEGIGRNTLNKMLNLAALAVKR